MWFHMACAVTNFDVRCDKHQVLADQVETPLEAILEVKIVSVQVVVSTEPTFQNEEMMDEMQMMEKFGEPPEIKTTVLCNASHCKGSQQRASARSAKHQPQRKSRMQLAASAAKRRICQAVCQSAARIS